MVLPRCMRIRVTPTSAFDNRPRSTMPPSHESGRGRCDVDQKTVCYKRIWKDEEEEEEDMGHHNAGELFTTDTDNALYISIS